jgi:Na+-translocating ferredoxin:NAD+ oxidoreductase RnfD subunit
VTTNSAIQRFFRTPKGLLTIVLVILLACAAPAEGISLVAPKLAAAVLAASLLDVFLLRYFRGEWQFPSGAILSGLLVAMILSPREPWFVPACSSAIAILSKYVARTRSANVFNPAALALVAAYYVFHAAQNWWGALPNISPFALLLLFASGIFIADRVNKLPLVLVFLGVYFALFTLSAFWGDPVKVAEIFRVPDLHAALFFAFFILTDPPTAPVKCRDQFVCGAIVALCGFLAFEWIGAVYYLLAGLLVGNIWEAWHRWRQFSRRRLSADAPGPSPA